MEGDRLPLDPYTWAKEFARAEVAGAATVEGQQYVLQHMSPQHRAAFMEIAAITVHQLLEEEQS